jgi:uncharacterized protein (TIGR01244 family)
MALSITRQSELFSTAPQIAIEDMQEIAELGIKTVINNRPDAEGGAAQPLSADLEKAALAAGLHYFHLPVISGQITEVQAAKFAELLATNPGPVLAFCRSGARSQNISQLAAALNKKSQPCPQQRRSF